MNSTSVAEAEVTVTAVSSPGVTGMTPGQFTQYLQANGFVGHMGLNPNYPGVVWIGFNNGI